MLIYPYAMYSQGAKAVALEMGVLRIKKEGSTFTGKGNPVVLNWGNYGKPRWADRCTIINDWKAVEICSDKLNFFKHLGHIDEIVPWTTSRHEALAWLNEGYTVLARKYTASSQGRGCVVMEGPENMVIAPLYTRYIPKLEEYRAHVMFGEVIDNQQKRRRLNVPDDKVNWHVRSYDNGFVYCRGKDVKIPKTVNDIALKVVKMIPGLDMAAVDVIYRPQEDRAWVCEINTAPGIEGTTVKRYAKALKTWEENRG